MSHAAKEGQILTSSFGAPAHAIESWLSSTADILQVDASFIYLPSVLIVAFRDSDVHSTDILFIRHVVKHGSKTDS